MPADIYRIGGGADATILNPIVMVALLIVMAFILVLPRKYIFLPILFTAILAPFGQQVVFMGWHWFIPRILITCGLIRMTSAKMFSRAEIVPGGFNNIDKIFVIWASVRAIATVLLFLEPQAVVNQAAFLIDDVGGYLLFRYLIRDEEDLVRGLKVFAVVVGILAVTMTIEQINQQSVFRYLGADFVSIERGGEIRAQGPFEGPIPAGAFGATLFCLFVWLWRSGKANLLGMVGTIGSLLIVYTSKSSTPLLGVVAGIVAILVWPLRNNMRLIRWGMIVALLCLQLVMVQPVWFVINHVSLVGGNSSYHRAMLVDQFIRHFSDWWLLGSRSTASWGFDMWDQANQFVKEGESGGLATFVLFLMLISRSFGRLGSARRISEGDSQNEWLCWMLGGALLSHIVCFFGNSFSDQSIHGWIFLLVIISVATTPILDGPDEEGDSVSDEIAEEQPWAQVSPSTVSVARQSLA
jgi:hypothetical protein